MTRSFFATAFLLGAAAILWMSSIFIGTDALALTVTVVIGAVYILGFIELHQFRQATTTLSSALDELSSNSSHEVSALTEWLRKLHPTLQNSVQLRIEGERVGLPAPVLTPYLVGLLVMLGLLGTFVGMVDTLKGAVIALEGSTELQAIRAGLAAPINGLGLAFGTSVAGVAASAMLGLMSTLSRRERMLETRQLDSKITTVFRSFSLVHNRQEAFKALQVQAHALPDVAEKLSVMALKLENMGERIGESLIANQESFHQSVNNNFTELANSVDKSLRESAAESSRITAESGRLVGESIKPIMKEVMAEISSEIITGAQTTHQQLTNTAQDQLQLLTGHFANTSEQVTQAWKTGLSAHEHSNEALVKSMNASFKDFSDKFESLAKTMVESFDKTSSSWVERQESGDKERLNLWADSFDQSQQQATTQLVDASKLFTHELKHVSDIQQSTFESVTQNFETMSSSLTAQWRQAGEQSVSQQQQISDSLQVTARDISDTAKSSTTNMLTEITSLLKSSEDLINVRVETESSWLQGHGERMNDLTSVMKTELGALKNEEHQRGQAALERLAALEVSVANHLATLGKELEAPMTRLIETASETPRAAAEVIEHLQREISNNIERDNNLLEERRGIMEQLNTLSSSLEISSTGQQVAIETLVTSSTNMLQNISSQFTDHVGAETSKLSDIVSHFAGSATEMSSLGEAFSFAVEFFNESNQNLVENLSRIEVSLDQSSTRSNEQLGYYVTQAREIIDHSILSQKQMLEELRQQSQQEELFAAEVN